MKAPIGKFKYAALLLALAPLSMAHACGARSPSYSYKGHVFSVNFACTGQDGDYVLTGVTLGNHKGAKLVAYMSFVAPIGPVAEGVSMTVKSNSKDVFIDADVVEVDIYKWRGKDFEGYIDCNVKLNTCAFHKPSSSAGR